MEDPKSGNDYTGSTQVVPGSTQTTCARAREDLSVPDEEKQDTGQVGLEHWVPIENEKKDNLLDVFRRNLVQMTGSPGPRALNEPAWSEQTRQDWLNQINQVLAVYDFDRVARAMQAMVNHWTPSQAFSWRKRVWSPGYLLERPGSDPRTVLERIEHDCQAPT